MSELEGKVIPVEIEDEIQKSYLTYAMSVIVSRALPDVRDGLKPVHRRILYAMEEMGLRSDKPFKKCGRIVGDVLGKYHPHGDQSIYDALVRLAQDFSLRYPVVKGQGNFGSIDGDPPAAMRYTEAKLAKIADAMIDDLDKETVDFVPNYDDSLKEPAVLPAALPYLLINGANGIAVGMATNMPPHNLSEICDAIDAYIRNPDIDVDELLHFVPGPDFPTGGIIQNPQGYALAAKTGKGSFSLRGRYHIEEGPQEKKWIVFTEIPYMVKKSEVIAKIAELVQDHKILGIADLRDESDREGMRIVIEVKRGFEPRVVLNSLFAHTDLRINYNVNNLALVKGRPATLNLRDLIAAFVDHRKEVVTRRSKFELRKAEERAHILEGLKIALENIDEVIKIIKEAENVPQAKVNLESRFGLSETQSQAILDMRLQRLTSLETRKVLEELQEVLGKIAYLRELLADERKIYEVIREETRRLKEEYGDPRRTEIQQEDFSILDVKQLIPNEEIVVTVSPEGYIKRVPLADYRRQERGGKGLNESPVKDVLVCSTHDTLIFLTNKGRAHNLEAYEIPQQNRGSRGKPLVGLLSSLDQAEEISAITTLQELERGPYLVLATRKGRLIRIRSKALVSAAHRVLQVVKLAPEDALVSTAITRGEDDLVLVTKNGYCLRLLETEIRAMKRRSQGVRGISLRSSDQLVGAIPIHKSEQILLITEKGLGKRLNLEEFKIMGRATKGIRCYKPKEKTGTLIGVLSLSGGEDILCFTEKGKCIRCPIDNIAEQGRSAYGVRIIRLEDEDRVSGLVKVSGGERRVQPELFS